MIVLNLPYPPTTNAIWTRTKQGMRRSDVYQAWLTEAGWRVKQQRPSKIEGAYSLYIEATRPDRRKRDIDNLLKSTSDLLTHMGIIEDDSLASDIHARWRDTGTGMTVTIFPAGKLSLAWPMIVEEAA